LSGAPTWERWRLAGVYRDEAVIHPLAAGTAALPGKQSSDGGFLFFDPIDRVQIAVQFLLPNRASAFSVNATFRTQDA
jgi:hypothetical protein